MHGGSGEGTGAAHLCRGMSPGHFAWLGRRWTFWPSVSSSLPCGLSEWWWWADWEWRTPDKQQSAPRTTGAGLRRGVPEIEFDETGRKFPVVGGPIGSGASDKQQMGMAGGHEM